MFHEMCGVDTNRSKSDQSHDLSAIQPLANGLAFREDGNRKQWYPAWGGKIDEKVNAEFIQAVVERICENEQVS